MFGIVIDKDGFKIDFFVLDNKGVPQEYELQDDEQVITDGWSIANGMNKPQWNGSEWIDTDPLPPIVPEPPQPTETEILQQKITQLESDNLTLNEQSLDLDFRLVMLEMGI